MPKRPWLIVAWLALAALAAVALLVPAATWTGWFVHPIRLERLGRVPESTEHAGRFVRLAWPTLAALTAFTLVLLVRLSPRREAMPKVESAPPLGARLWIVVGLMIVAAFVRAPRLIESLWFDEIATLLDYAQFGPAVIVANAFTQANHTLHTLATWLSMAVFGGVDELILRVPTLLVSLATIPALWWLASEALPDRPRVGPMAALLAATMPVVVLSGVEARGYSTMILFAALVTAQLLRAWRTGNAGDFALYALLAALGVWAHLVAVCVPLAHGVLALWRLRCTATRPMAVASAVALALSALLTLILLTPTIPDLIAIRRDFLALDGDEPTLWGPEGLHALLQLGGSWAWWATLPGLALAVVGAVPLARSRTGRVVLVTGLVGGAVAALLATIGNSWLYARFLLFMVPMSALAIAAALDLVADRRGPATAAALAIALVALWIADLTTRPPKQPLREAVALVAQLRAPHERVATIGLPDNLLAYYGQTHDLAIHPTGPLGVALAEALPIVDPDWVIVLYQRSVPPERLEFLRDAGFREHTRLAGWADWGNGDVVIWHRTAPER